MVRFKIRRLITILVALIIVTGIYAGWQISQRKQIDNYSANAQKFTQESNKNSNSSNIPESKVLKDSHSSGNYKQLMSGTHQQTLQAMQNVKDKTLALQENSISLSAYEETILQAQATFSTAEAFVQANPPTEEKLKAPYQEFLAGISLAKGAMGVVLNGISSWSLSDFYTAREMGRNAQQQVINGYTHF